MTQPDTGGPKLTATIITLDEEDNLPRAIASVKWASEVLVVDSGSSDNTVQIAKDLGARVIHNDWHNYGNQKNFAQSQAKHDWVLNIDADEEVEANLADQIKDALKDVEKNAENDPDRVHGFSFPRKTQYLGRWILHGGWYPNVLTRLANRKFARWTEPEVHEELVVQGRTQKLSAPLNHFTFNKIEDQILTNLNFSRLGAKELVRRGQRASLIKLLLKPIGKFLETYLIKLGFLDGLPGLIISINAAHSMFLKYAYLFEKPKKEGRE